MNIRILGKHEILSALRLVWNVFVNDVAPEYSPEGVAEFQKFIKYDNIAPQVDTDGLVFFGAWDRNDLCGVSAIDRRGHIALMFVRKDRQRRGIGRMLFQEMCRYSMQALHIDRITVNAVPSSVEVYRHLGMRDAAPEQCQNGVRYIPMEMMVLSGMMQAKPKTNKKIWIIIGAIAAFVILIVTLFCMFVFRIVNSDMANDIQELPYQYEEEFDFGDDLYGDDTYEEEEIGGMEGIPEYIQDNTGYELTEESYILNPQDTDTTRTTIAFEIYYPQLSGLNSDVQTKVNEELKNCAMESAERIYLNPTDEIKEKVLGEEYPVLMSYVEYKVTYLTEDVISVVYQDYCYEGSEYDYYLELRTRNISLKDGTVYEVKDIVKLNERFIGEWLEEMQDEAEASTLLSELNVNEMESVLSGDDMEGVYKDNFFLDAEGIEIGLSFRYPENDENDHGYSWVTAPFEWDDIRPYQNDSDFWALVR